MDGRNFLDQLIKKDLKMHDTITKFGTGQGHDYTTGYLVDYYYFKNYYKLIVIDLIKQQK